MRRKPWRAPSPPCPCCWLPAPRTAPAPRLPSVVSTLACRSLGFCLSFTFPKCVMPPSQLIHVGLLSAETQHIKGFLQGHRGKNTKELLASCFSEWRSPSGGTNGPWRLGLDAGGQTDPDRGESLLPGAQARCSAR